MHDSLPRRVVEDRVEAGAKVREQALGRAHLLLARVDDGLHAVEGIHAALNRRLFLGDGLKLLLGFVQGDRAASQQGQMSPRSRSLPASNVSK